MNEEKAIETLKEVANDDFDTLGDDISPKMAQNILNVINNQQKEIEEKNIAVNKMSKDISRQLEEIEEKTTIIMAGAEKVKQLEKEIKRLEKDNDTLSELVIVNEDKVIKELDLISKDKIREAIKNREIELYADNPENNFIPFDKVIDTLKELLEEN